VSIRFYEIDCYADDILEELEVPLPVSLNLPTRGILARDSRGTIACIGPCDDGVVDGDTCAIYRPDSGWLGLYVPAWDVTYCSEVEVPGVELNSAPSSPKTGACTIEATWRDLAVSSGHSDRCLWFHLSYREAIGSDGSWSGRTTIAVGLDLEQPRVATLKRLAPTPEGYVHFVRESIMKQWLRAIEKGFVDDGSDLGSD
jgi:hypothetical protein